MIAPASQSSRKNRAGKTGQLGISNAGAAEVPIKRDTRLDWHALVESYILTGDTFDALQWPAPTKKAKYLGEHVRCHAGKWQDDYGGKYLTERQLRNQWDRQDEEWKTHREKSARLKREEYQTKNQHWSFNRHVKRDTSLRQDLDLSAIFESYGNIFDSDDGGKAFEKIKLSGDELEAALACLDTLGLDETATDRQIKNAYRRKAAEHHPDRGGSGADFKRVKLAYGKLTGEVLLKRKKPAMAKRSEYLVVIIDD